MSIKKNMKLLVNINMPQYVEELQKENSEVENATEEVSFQADQEIAHAKFQEQQHRDIDSKEQQQYAPRRPYQNQRGGSGRGGCRGYPNGRGGGRGSGRGGSYQSGRGQYHDEGNNYYPRNNYRGRGGKGGGGGNTYYNYNHSSGMQGAPAQSNAASAS